MEHTLTERQFRNHPETHPETVTRLQRTGTLDFTESVRRGIRPATPRLAFATIGTHQRWMVIRKIINLTRDLSLGYNRDFGCCAVHTCGRHFLAFNQSVAVLQMYAAGWKS